MIKFRVLGIKQITASEDNRKMSIMGDNSRKANGKRKAETKKMTGDVIWVPNLQGKITRP
jgi:hypothetical protein